jgi:hypothetical protein
MNPPHLPELGLSVLTIPKNGGTTLFHWIFLLRTGREVSGNVYDQYWLQDGGWQEETLIVRRDPVERFISGYRNFRDKRGLTLAFGDFVKRLPEMLPHDGNLRHHFAPQSDYYPANPLPEVDHVFDFEDFSSIRAFLEERSEKSLPDYHEQKSHFRDFEVTDEEVELIQQYYLNDYVSGFGEVVADDE